MDLVRRGLIDRGRCAILGIAAAATLGALAQPAFAGTPSVVGFGGNFSGRIGDGTTENRPLPVATSGLSQVSAIASGGSSSAAVVEGAVEAWGAGELGELGNGGTSKSTVPVAVAGISTATSVSVGGGHMLALLANGHVTAWGENSNGQLGVGTKTGPELCGKTACSTTPVEVPGISEATAVVAGSGFSLALLANGHVLSWGNNENGELGNGSHTSSSTPGEVKGLSGVTAIDAGGPYGLALLSNGHVMSWGYNNEGQLGNGTTTGSAVPVEVKSLAGVTAVAGAGFYSAVALLESGELMSWGGNFDGELGVGKGGKSTVPVKVIDVSGATAISGGADGVLALLEDHDVISFGEKVGYPSGRGWFETPTGVCGLSGVTMISGGSSTGLAYRPGIEPVPPTLDAVSPNVGPQGGGTAVTLSGSGIGAATQVAFGATAAGSFKAVGEDGLEAVSPAGEGVVDVRVTTPTGTTRCPFRYVPAPVVTKVGPKTVSAAGGTPVRILGSNLRDVTSVHFGPYAASFSEKQTSGEMNATVPAGTAGKVPLTVTTAGGTSSGSVIVKMLPEVAQVVPAKGPAGTKVTVKGAGFSTAPGGTQIRFDKAKTTDVSCSSTTECTVTAPTHAPGQVDLKVTIAKVASKKTALDRFTYE